MGAFSIWHWIIVLIIVLLIVWKGQNTNFNGQIWQKELSHSKSNMV